MSLFWLKTIPYVLRLSSYAALWGAAERECSDFVSSLKTRRLDEELQLLAIKNADAVVSPSHLIGNITQERVHRNIDIVESPVLIPEECSLELNEDMLASNKYFVTYGALVNRKSIHMLTEVIDNI